MTGSDRASLLAHLEACSAGSFDPTLLLDRGLEVLAASAAAEEYFCAPPGSLRGRPFAALCAPEAVEAAVRRLAELGPAGRARFESVLRARTGGEAPAEVSAVAVEAGGASGLLLAVRDLTEQRRAEGWFRLAVEESPYSIALSRMDDGTFVAVNDAFVRLQGRSREETLGRSALELGVWAEPEERRALVERLRREGVVRAADILVRRADGSLRVEEYSARRVMFDGAEHLISFARDVSAARALEVEHARLAAELRVQQELLNRVLEAMEEGVWVLDGEGVTLFANPRVAEILGVAGESMVGRSHLDFVPAENVAEALRMQAEVTGGAMLRQEFSHRKPDGSIAHIWTSLSPLREADGRISGSIGVLLDVTERKEAEDRLATEKERLASSEQRYRLLADNASDVIWRLDLSTLRLSYVSPSVVKLSGFTPGETMAMSLDQVLTPSSLAAMQALVGTLGTPEEQDTYTALIDQRCRDGSIRHVEVSATLVRDPAGRPTEAVGVSRDATARAEAELALRKSEERFRALIEKSTDIIMVFDAEMRLQFWSPSATQCLGWQAEEVLGRTLHELELIHPDDRAALAEAIRSAKARPGEIIRIEARNRHRDGSWRLLQSTGSDLLDDPAVRGVVVNARDVTEQRRLEEQLRQTQKLESIGRLAGGVAHDFNNLLTVILSCAESLKEQLGAGAPVDPTEVEEILASGWRARDLTRHLLAFARKQAIAPVRLDLNGVVRRGEKLLRRVLGEDVRLEVDLEPALWPVVCDPSQVDQALMNLVVNARDAMPGGGVITLGTRNAGAPPGGEPRDQVTLFVRDTGVGMPAEVRAHLFEPFFTTKEPGKGTGLGLATVYGVVTQSGGTVQVESEPGRGSTIELRFPRAAGAPEPAQAAPPPLSRARTGSERLLVVEDDPQVRAVTVRTLERAGYRLLVAASGREALALLEHQDSPLDLVVTDVVMPGMSGRALVEELRRRQPGLRALYLSGYGGDAIARHGLLDEGIELLAKPFTPDALQARVRAVLDDP